METLIVARRTIVEQLSLFLTLRRRKWTELRPFLDEYRLTRPAFFLLRALEGETVRGQTLTVQQMQESLFNPYSTRSVFLDDLPLLIERGYLQQQGDGYVVTDAGRNLCNRIELAARAYLASLEVTPSISLSALVGALMERVYGSWQAQEPLIKAHQARTQRRLSVERAPALVQIEWAVLGLWEARDDAHIAAWRAYRFSGPVFDILSRIWSKETQTLPGLIAILGESQHPADIQQGIQELIGSGYSILVDDHFKLTRQGQEIRDEIERETDRIFFSSWSEIADDKVIWLSEQLREVCTYFRELA
ncbi:helix-turn-helix domain-containing protein [Tengunoibacter tsumagoiensis]|uniref:Uncharacterized protein n=1 Tax=Tengunoibacter tsumagoiensis TaxID=2014871 RepID=A0A402A015_9CHLR|nr:hypothetical protein [Tengunoibacter tsumagoiensis]GCE12392.1 hypothetical protein KTT_22510 [Tengunoibacter tsumagoiensis]